MNQIIINTCTTETQYTDTFPAPCPDTFPGTGRGPRPGIPVPCEEDNVSFQLDGETRERVLAYAKLEHLALPVFFRSIIDCGLKTYEYQGGF